MSKVPRTLVSADDLIARAYWALTINALAPVSEEDCYCQDDISELVDHLMEYLNG